MVLKRIHVVRSGEPKIVRKSRALYGRSSSKSGLLLRHVGRHISATSRSWYLGMWSCWIAARAEVDGIHVRFQFFSASTVRWSWRGGGSEIVPESTLASHAACRPCVRMLLKVDTSEPRKARPGTPTGSIER